MKTKKEKHPVRAYLEPEEVAQLENAATNLRDRLLIRILFHLGCRVSEALAISVADIDFKQQTITILHLKTRFQLSCPKCGTRLGRRHSFCPECGQKVKDAVSKEQEHRRLRTLPIDKDTLAILSEYIKRGGPVTKRGCKLIFGISRHRAWQVVKECAEKARLPKLLNSESGHIHYVSPHRLRDAFAVHAMRLDDSGDGQRLLQQHLGHSSFNTTAKYRKISGTEHRDWFERLWSVSVEEADGTQT